jgi:AcrR family transcriptional regulator
MPRIAADTVAEHVAQQEAAVVAAAARLFSERGVARVSLADIAAEVGLKRNSLYRYFPDKGHLLAAWFRLELAPLQARSEAIVALDEPAPERLRRWLELQLDYLTAPEHQAMTDAVAESASLSDEVRADIGQGHRELYATLASILDDAAGDHLAAGGEEPRIRVDTMLIAGSLRSAAELVLAGVDRVVVLDRLVRLALALAES